MFKHVRLALVAWVCVGVFSSGARADEGSEVLSVLKHNVTLSDSEFQLDSTYRARIKLTLKKRHKNLMPRGHWMITHTTSETWVEPADLTYNAQAQSIFYNDKRCAEVTFTTQPSITPTGLCQVVQRGRKVRLQAEE